jgi:hypothetical protein
MTTALFVPTNAEQLAYAERTGIQLRALEALAELLGKARGEGLPPLVWQIDGMCIHGRALCGTPDQLRVMQDDWAALLGAKHDRDQRHGEHVWLRATARWHGDPLITFVITQEFDDYEEVIDVVQ